MASEVSKGQSTVTGIFRRLFRCFFVMHSQFLLLFSFPTRLFYISVRFRGALCPTNNPNWPSLASVFGQALFQARGAVGSGKRARGCKQDSEVFLSVRFFSPAALPVHVPHASHGPAALATSVFGFVRPRSKLQRFTPGPCTVSLVIFIGFL